MRTVVPRVCLRFRKEIFEESSIFLKVNLVQRAVQ